jgi:UDP-N-acetylglucosamine 2-epimerase (non-hydrolysing)
VFKVLAVFGTRPEAVKMAPVIHQLQKYPDQIECRVCVTGQHRQMLDQTLAIFQIQPDIDLNLMQPGQSLAGLTARVVERMSAVLKAEKPDLLLVQGDTTTVMAAALAAFYEKVAVGHVEAGLRTGDPYSPFPEEINRRIAAVLTSHHFAPTKTSVEALLAERIPAEKIYCTGNTVVDALLWTAAQKPSFATGSMLHQLGFTQPGQGKKRILVTAHRRENFGEPLEEICQALRAIVERNPEVELIYPVHLNPNVQEPVRRILSDQPRIHLIEPLSYEPFVHLMKAVDLVLTDSGGIQEEAPVFGKPVLVLRNETERPEAVAAGTVKLVGADRQLIISQTEALLHNPFAYAAMANAVSPYGDGHAAERIVEVILGLAEKTQPVLLYA